MAGKIAFFAPNDSQLAAHQRVAPEGVEISWVDSNLPVDEAAEQLKDTMAVIVGGGAFSLELAQKLSNLSLIQVTSAGTDRLDKAALGELGIRVANNGGGNAVAVAEHTIAMMVNVYRKMQLQLNSVKDGQWAGGLRGSEWFEQAHELTDKTIGIIGLGRIGSRVARRLQGWECELIYSDVIDVPELEQDLGIKKVSKEELLETSDIVTLHVPLNRQTRGMISDAEFDMMKDTAVLINCCRGPVVDEAALIRALEQKKIASAGLDVLEVEPTPTDNPILKFDNALVTPHLASFAQEAGEKSRVFAMQNVARVAAGEAPESIVLPDD